MPDAQPARSSGTPCQARLLRVAGRHEDCRREGAEGGLPQARDAVPPGPQSGRPHRRAQVQGNQRSLRDAEGPAEAGRLRPLRPCRLREWRQRRRRLRRRLRRLDVRHLRGHLRRHDGRPPRAPAAAARGRERGADLRYNMEITLEEAFAGKTAQIRVPTSIACRTAPAPAPSPARARRPARPAAATAGCAPRRASSRSSAPARTARAAARSSTIPCPKCAGQGRVTEERTLSVNIPAGIEDGTRIRLANEGEAGLRGGPPATSTSSCRSSRTSSSSATAPTSSARCRSR